MSRWVQLCEVCGQLGPYGLPAVLADGAPGHLWACEAHRAAVRAQARATSAERPPPARTVAQGQ